MSFVRMDFVILTGKPISCKFNPHLEKGDAVMIVLFDTGAKIMRASRPGCPRIFYQITTHNL